MTYHRLVAGPVLAYRALFTWLNPLGYLSSRIVRPIGLTVTFGALTSHYGADVGPTLVGASLLAGAHAVIYGMALSVGNERPFGTLDVWLGSPQNKVLALAQRALPHTLDAFAGGMITYGVSCALFGVLPLAPTTFAALLALALVSAFGYGMFVGGVAFHVKDVFLTPNLAYLALMVVSGALVPVDSLPAVLRAVAAVSPMRHVMADPLHPDLAAAAVGELAAGLGWLAVGAVLVWLGVRRKRR